MSKAVNKRRAARPSIESDSLTSFFTPWEKNRAPPIYPNAQTGRTVTVTEFCLFYVAVVLLILSLGLTGISIWSLSYKSYYSFLNCSTELAYFALPAAILCLPCSWIVFSVHNDKKTRKFLSLVLILLTFSAVLMVIGVYVGFTHKLHLKLGQNGRNPVLGEFRESMRQSMKLYGREGKSSKVWNDVQAKLGCCGVDNYTDWFQVTEKLPESCCGQQASCRVNSTSATGCLKMIMATLVSQTCLFSGINCVALFMQCCVFLVVAIVYIRGKRHDEE